MSTFRFGSYGGYMRPNFFGGFSFFPPVIKSLIISNTVVFLLTGLLLKAFTVGGVPLSAYVVRWFALWPVSEFFLPWQLVTYMFLHGDFLHLFLNMLMLWMFGMEMEHLWGSKKFAIYYLLCGLGAGIANLIIPPMLGQGGATVGASGGVFGILVAFGMMFPDRSIYLYFLLPIRARFFILAWIGLDLLWGVSGSSRGIAHFAHLGGALTGFLWMLGEMNLVPVRAMWQRVRREFRNPFGKSERFVRRDSRRYEPTDARFYDIKTRKPIEDDTDVNQQVIDAILDKISVAGYQSLTPDEKRILNEASKKIH